MSEPYCTGGRCADCTPEDPPAAPEPAPAENADDSETETIPAAPEGAPASPESEE